MAERPTSEKTIFQAAMEKTSLAEREAYLVEACGGNEQLRRGVEALLAAHDRLPSPSDIAASPQSEIDLDPPLMFAAPGTIIGRYKLLEPIGQGGYGVVVMAEQTSPTVTSAVVFFWTPFRIPSPRLTGKSNQHEITLTPPDRSTTSSRNQMSYQQ